MEDKVKNLMLLTAAMKAKLGGTYTDESSPRSCLDCCYAVGQKEGDVCLMQCDGDVGHRIPWSRWDPQEMPLDTWHDPDCPLIGGGVNDAAKILFHDGIK